MKKTLAIFLLALTGFGAYAQETPAKFKLYGFIRNYTIVDTREVKAGTNDLYFYMPQDVNLAPDGTTDLNQGINWRSLSLTTRLGLDVSGYQFGSMSIGGKVEADFYSLNGTGTAQTIAQLRLRQAFVALGWDFSEGERLGLTVGQAWHPMAADMPHMTNLETGAPFNPFNRSPQMMLSYTTGGWTFTGGLLYLNHYLPMDAQAGGKSVAPFKYGLPEAYAGVSFRSCPIVARVGVDILNTKPFRTYTVVQDEGTPEEKTVVGGKAGGLMTAISPFVFFQYTCFCEPVEECGFACISVSYDSSHGYGRIAALLPLQLSVIFHFQDLMFQDGDSFADGTAVQFQLLFSGTPGAYAAALP